MAETKGITEKVIKPYSYPHRNQVPTYNPNT